MYVCICNSLNERKVRAAIDAGASRPLHVYRHHGCAPRCGCCLPVMQAMLAEVEDTREAEPVEAAVPA